MDVYDARNSCWVDGLAGDVLRMLADLVSKLSE